MKKRTKAFTLAEVLITLTILGVVAAITVPSLQKQNYKRTQVSRMAKGYATLENAAANIAQNTNCIGKNLECTGLLDITNEQELNNKFAELANLRVNKKRSGIVMRTRSLYYETDKNQTLTDYTVFVTSPDNIAYSVGKTTLTGTKSSNALRITIFTDDKKLKQIAGKGWEIPAIFGRDVFRFVLYDNFQVAPLVTGFACWQYPLKGSTESSYIEDYCNPKKNNYGCYLNGMNCSARIIRDGWKMKY